MAIKRIGVLTSGGDAPGGNVHATINRGGMPPTAANAVKLGDL